MKPSVVIIHEPAIDFATLLGVAQQALGYSPGAKADQVRRDMPDGERFISILSAFHDAAAPAGLTPNLLSHISYSVLVVAEERDLIDIAEAASGISMVCADSVSRGVMLAVFTGTLAKWRDAVKTGSVASAQYNVRSAFNDILRQFDERGLSVWKDQVAKPIADQTFLLEDKRR